jgi:hypothetical protein
MLITLVLMLLIVGTAAILSVAVRAKTRKLLKWVAITTGIITLALLFYVYFSDFMLIDACLDSGGRWNYETRTCER